MSIKLPKHLDWGFSDKNAQPTDIEIDWSSPQARGLLLAYSGNDDLQGISELTGRGSRAVAFNGTDPVKILKSDPRMYAGKYSGANGDKDSGLSGLPQTGFTVAFWIDARTGTNDGYWELGDGGTGNRFLLYRDTGSNFVIFSAPAGANIYSGSAASGLTRIMLTFVSGSIQRYDNGVFHSSSSTTWSTPSGIDTISFGNRNDGGFPGDCDIADFRMWDHIKTAEEAALDYDINSRWDLFKPVFNVPILSPASTAPPASFIPAWAKGANVMIQGGIQ